MNWNKSPSNISWDFYINSVKKNDPIATHATPMCQIAYPKPKIRIPLQAPTVQET